MRKKGQQSTVKLVEISVLCVYPEPFCGVWKTLGCCRSRGAARSRSHLAPPAGCWRCCSDCRCSQRCWGWNDYCPNCSSYSLPDLHPAQGTEKHTEKQITILSENQYLFQLLRAIYINHYKVCKQQLFLEQMSFCLIVQYCSKYCTVLYTFSVVQNNIVRYTFCVIQYSLYYIIQWSI